MSEHQMRRVAEFAHLYRRMVQGYADQLSMISQMPGWTPPQGWMIRSDTQSLCCIGNVLCVVDTEQIDLRDLLVEMREVSRW
jgi:roadblock/LC7 domain-containing protein